MFIDTCQQFIFRAFRGPHTATAAGKHSYLQSAIVVTGGSIA